LLKRHNTDSDLLMSCGLGKRKTNKEVKAIFKIQNPNAEFKCKYPGCCETFKKLQGLGGHTSKAHPNFSQNYARKILIRNEREDVRIRNKEIKKILVG